MKTTINGKEIKILGRQEIGMAFTQKVNEYLSRGFIFNWARSSGGTQGEEMKACLTNDGGKTVYIIFLEDAFGGFENPDKMIIQVKKYENADDSSTLWLNQGEFVEHIIFYTLETTGKCFKSRWVESLEDYELIKAIQNKRYAIHRECDIVFSDKYKKLAWKIIRKKSGYKSTPLKDVIKVIRKKHKE